ncbi:TetR/AcrR family transcriptional regulator [Antrihabitans cavernicola]|uniref:TetR/AcrR family transcriptional regulator n=1 Tax=Antrihabitans cavernicola TaxID=2495913 RepID=UPI0016594563|nr:TetR/AcrR family transcriptional regulator [Spelaeibacter cavernicola]
MTRTTPATAPRRRGRPPGPPVDPEIRRENILDAAERVIARTGPAIAFADIATEAGFARTAVYAVFPDRDSLLSALTVRHTDRIIAVANDILARPLPLREVFRELVEMICTFVADNPQLHPALMQGLHAPQNGGHRPLFTRNADWATAVFEVVLDSVGADRRSARTWAGATVGALLLAAEDWSAEPRVSKTELVDQLTAFIWPAIESVGGDALSGPLIACVSFRNPGGNTRDQLPAQAAGTLSRNPNT